MRIMLLIMLFVSIADIGYAQDGTVAVIALDDSPSSRKTASRMAEMLLSSGRVVSFGAPAFERYTAHLVPLNPNAASKFEGFAARVEKGTKAFFYKGERRAIERLSPLFQVGLAEFGYISARPDLAALVFETGVLLIRAYDGLGRASERDATAELVAKFFPAREPSLERSPPKIIELVRAAKTALHASGSRLGIEPVGGNKCVGILNGVEVKQGMYPVASNAEVFVQARCGQTLGPLMKINVKPNQTAIALVPVAAIDPSNMVDDSFESRRAAESRLRVLKFWGGFDEVVGVKTPETDGDPPTLFALLRQDTITWTETVGVPAFVGFVEQTFSLPTESTPQSDTDFVAWALVGGSVLAIGGGAALYVLGQGKTQALICSDNATQKPVGNECDGVTDLGQLTRDEFTKEVRNADTMVITGAILAGVGMGALAWGIVRLIWADTQSVAILPASNGVQVQGVW